MSGPRISLEVTPFNKKQAIFRYDGRTVTIEYDGNGSVNKIGGLKDIRQTPLGMVGSAQSYWSSGVDAQFPNPPQMGKDTHFFCGEWYFSLSSPPQVRISRGPMKIVDAWPLLKQYNFTRVNVAQPVPRSESTYTDHVWFFSGSRGFRAKNTYNSNGTISQEIQGGVSGPYTLTERWQSLNSLGFATVDATFPDPTHPNRLFVFSGSQFGLVEVPADANATLVRGPRPINDSWPALSDFYP